MPTVILFAPVSGSAEAEEAVRVGISVETQCLDLADPGGDQPVHEIGFKVEVWLCRGASNKKALVVGIILEKAQAERLVDFIGNLGNARTDRGMDIVAASAQSF